MKIKLRDRLLLSFGGVFGLAAVAEWLLTASFSDEHTQADPLLLALAACVTLVATTCLAIGLARAISGPLEALVAAVRAIAAGRFDVRVDYSGLTEADALAANFNDMAETLEAYNSTSIDRLLAEQRRNEAVLTSIDDGLIILDDEARIERINPIAARQLGLSEVNSIGCTLDELLGTSRFDRRVLDCIQRQQGALEDEFELRGEPSQSGRELTCVLSPFHEPTRPGLVMVLRDVTAERRFARMQNDFVMHASHELRSPVAGLSMSLSLLDERLSFDADSREDDLFATALHETGRLKRLVDDLLDLSRLEQSGAALQAEPLDAVDLLQAACERFAHQAAEAQITLSNESEPQAAPLHGDKALLSRLLDNLLSNALRYTPAGGRVRLSTRSQSGQMVLEVADNGCGIGPVEIRRIFEPFSQFGARPGGAGLGLTLCREIAERHGGHIDVVSAPGQGARFHVCLPWPKPRDTPVTA